MASNLTDHMVFLIKWLEQRLTGTAVFVLVGIIRKTRKDPKIETIGMAANIDCAHLFIDTRQKTPLLAARMNAAPALHLNL